MSGGSQGSGSFVVGDYVIFALMLLISAAVGIYYAWVDRRKQTSENFLTGGRGLSAFPIALSLTATSLSAVTVLSSPAEVYSFGAIYAWNAIANVIAMVVAAEIFLPVFYRLGITTTYRYLELRFDTATRLFGTAIYICQALLCTGIIVYGPALALNQVTGLDLWGGIISTGVVCAFYCTLGGLKAVVWTDVFQIGIMLSGYLAVIIQSIIVQGGVSVIISDAQQGGRLNFWDFDLNPFRRYTFWTIIIGGTVNWLIVYGTTQSQVQRYIACKNLTHARLSVYINLVGLCFFLGCTVFAGLSIYSVYKDCDPWTSRQVSSPDQLLPYLVMDLMVGYPGLPGLFFAAVYSGSLSTVSSAINSMATVTVEDFIKPFTNWSEKTLSRVSKGLTLFYGILCILLAGLASLMGAMIQTVITIGGVLGGPLLGVFSLGILCPFANSKGSLSGGVCGLVASVVVCSVALISPPPPSTNRPLTLSTEGCNFTTTDTNWTSTVLPTEQTLSTTAEPVVEDELLTPSYLYYSVIGFLTTVVVGLIVSLLTGGLTTQVESKLMLKKDDLTIYHIFKFFKDRLIKQTRETDLTLDKDEGKTNPAFCDLELKFSTAL